MLKKVLVGAAAAAALMTPTLAVADTSGVVGLEYSSHEIDGGDDWDNYALSGGFSHDFSNGTLLQVDGATSRSTVDDECCETGAGYTAVHYGTRNENYGLAGYIGFQDNFTDVSSIGVGVEGQWFLTNLVFNGSIGYQDYQDGDFSATGAQVDGAYFFTSNLAVTGLVSFAQADEIFDDVDATTYGIGGEWRFDGSPASIVVGYRSTDLETGIGDVELDSWTIGLNLDLGTGSLRERATSGPSFNGAASFNRVWEDVGS